MEYDATPYHQAIARLDYIETVRQSMCALLNRLTDGARSHMYLSARDYDRAMAIISEAISDMYYEEAAQARHIKELYERQDWREYEREMRQEGHES